MRKNLVTPSRLSLVFAAAILAASGATAQQPAMVLEGGTLIDGTGKPPLTDAVIVVEAGRIKAVGKKGQVAVPAGAQMSDLTGRTILPGLIDSHTHTQDWQIPMFTHYGVTTIADKNNYTAWILAERDMLKSGKMKGPRMFVSGSGIEGIQQGQRVGLFTDRNAVTVADAEAAARSRIAAGVDMITINNNLTDDQVRAVIVIAKAAGKPVLGHTMNIKRAASLGAVHMEHMDTMARSLLDPDEKIPLRLQPETFGPVEPPQVAPEAQVDPKQFPALISYMVAHGVFVNPTLVAGWWASSPRGKEFAADSAQIIKDPGLGFAPQEVREGWAKAPSHPRDGFDHVAQFVKDYAAAGGKLVVGTDTGFDDHAVPGRAVHDEMRMMVDAGVPAMKAIEAATLWNAQLIQKDKDLGSVEAGKIADFTVIEGDPLANISNTKNVRMVIKDGKVLDTTYDPKWVNPIPMPFSTETRPHLLLTDFSPRMAPQGGGNVTIAVSGTNFTPGAVVDFDNVPLPTHFESSTKLTAQLPAADLRKNPGSYPLFVVDTGYHGTVSNAGYFVVNVK